MRVPEVIQPTKVEKSRKKPTSPDKNEIPNPQSKVQANKNQLVVAIEEVKKVEKTGK